MKRGLRSARRAAYAATCISYCAVSGSSVAWLKFVYGGASGRISSAVLVQTKGGSVRYSRQ
jgi:hypothetical protein